ncbi:CAMK family protein kinase [Trichoderma austrokoningii]
MADANLIARLYPVDPTASKGRALYTVNMDQNRSRYMLPESIFNDGHYSKASSVSSVSLEEEEVVVVEEEEEVVVVEEEEEEDNYMYSEGLELRFDDPRKRRVGVVIGRGPNCDIVLPSLESVKGVGENQCVLMFDDQQRLILRDMRNPDRRKDGTYVTYDGKGGFKRRGFTWILGGDDFTEDKKIIIALHKNLKFRIVVAPHDIHSAQHKENVARFLNAATADVDDLTFNGMDLRSVESTAAPTGVQTPSREAILLDNGELGRGGQAVVKRIWNVSTGQEYASKEPLKREHWEWLKKEAQLLSRLSHVNIVQLVHLMDEPVPRLILEYVPLGSLATQAQEKPISAEENLEILRQSLAALTFLHERDNPVAHRDIKPDNILVHSRNPLHIKLSDFGFSKQKLEELKTDCGTYKYAAPEVYKGQLYNEAVDIWSLGVVVLKFSHGLPQWESHWYGVRWAEKIIGHLEEAASRQAGCLLLAFLSKAMLLTEAKDRYSACLCSEAVSQLAISPCCSPTAAVTYKGQAVCLADEDEPTVTYHHQTVYPVEQDGTTIRPGVENEGYQDGVTAWFHNSENVANPDNVRTSLENVTASTDAGSHAATKRTLSKGSTQSRSSSLDRRTKRARSETSEVVRPNSELRYIYDKLPVPLHDLSSSVPGLDNAEAWPSESSGHSAPGDAVEVVDVQQRSEPSLLPYPDWLLPEGPQWTGPGPEVPLRREEDQVGGTGNVSDEYAALYALHNA